MGRSLHKPTASAVRKEIWIVFFRAPRLKSWAVGESVNRGKLRWECPLHLALRPSHLGNCPSLRSGACPSLRSGTGFFAESIALGFAQPTRMRRPSEVETDCGTSAASDKLRRNRTLYFVLCTSHFVLCNWSFTPRIFPILAHTIIKHLSSCSQSHYNVCFLRASLLQQS